jgi:hypothetical protein
VFLFKNGTGSHRNNIQLGKFGRNRTNVWNYPDANTFSRSDSEENLLALHPTPKPVALIADAIKDCTARGDPILDPFLGSGTAVIAAECSGRRYYGLELDPPYVDTIIRRWQRQTKQSNSCRDWRDFQQQRKQEGPIIMSNENMQDDYEVGYKKPPKNSQFQKGIFGNTRGRPRKSLDLNDQLIRESRSFMTIHENGQKDKDFEQELVIKQLVKLAMTRDTRAFKFI